MALKVFTDNLFCFCHSFVRKKASGSLRDGSFVTMAGLLPTRPLTSINEKWAGEGHWSCDRAGFVAGYRHGSRIGLAGYP